MCGLRGLRRDNGNAQVEIHTGRKYIKKIIQKFTIIRHFLPNRRANQTNLYNSIINFISAQHFFADLTFLEVNNCCSIEKEVAIFVDKSSLLEECENGNLEKGFYEESQMVAWEGPTESEDDESDNGSYGSGGSSSCWGNYPMREDDEEERRRNTGMVNIQNFKVMN